MLEAKAPFTEVHLTRDAGIDHPLQRAVDGRTADPLVFSSDEIDEVVGAEVPLLPQENVENLLAFAGTFAAFRFEAIDREWKRHCKVKGQKSKVKGQRWKGKG